jgi:hypothetical protein
MRSLPVLAVSLVMLGSGAAQAACEITNLAPTGVLPTTPSQPFSFVATNDCTMLAFRAMSGAITKTPRAGMMLGTDRRRYTVSLTMSEWNAIASSTEPTLEWSVSGRFAGMTTRVQTTNELDFDADGWTRSDGDLACDLDAASNPGVDEVCDNGTDDDCDGTVDDCAPGDPIAIIGTTLDILQLGSFRSLAAGDIDGD